MRLDKLGFITCTYFLIIFASMTESKTDVWSHSLLRLGKKIDVMKCGVQRGVVLTRPQSMVVKHPGQGSDCWHQNQPLPLVGVCAFDKQINDFASLCLHFLTWRVGIRKMLGRMVVEIQWNYTLSMEISGKPSSLHFWCPPLVCLYS